MKPRTLSASAIKAFESCPAMFRAKYIQRAPDPSGDAGLRGSAVHGALEDWVAGGYYAAGLSYAERTEKMTEIVERNYWQHLTHGGELEFCLSQALHWVERTDLCDGREVLATETKMRFDLPTSVGKIPISYIFDRLDRLPNGDIEVTDYKTWVKNIQPAELKWDIQARIYALAAWIQHKEAERVWVTFDQTRYRDIGMAFSQEDNKVTWRYLKMVAERILESNGTEETLNHDCRFCPRRRVCNELKRHSQVGGELAVNDIDDAISRRHDTAAQIKGLEAMLADLDRYILTHANDADTDEFDNGAVRVEITSRKTNTVDQEKLVHILGDQVSQFAISYGGLTVTAVKKALKDRNSWLGDDMLIALEGLIDDKFASLRVNTEQISPIELAS